MRIRTLTHISLVALFAVALASPADAMRLLRASVTLDGKEILTSSTGDNGSPDADAVWNRLKTLDFKPTAEFAKLGLAADAKSLTIGGDLPGAAKRVRRVQLSIAYGGMAYCWTLKLVRAPAHPDGPRWRVHADEIDRHFQYRMISRTEAARLKDPRRKK